ncbi:protein [Lentinula edodes]|uniref:Protein n=1 Tax=Lentinula edodes TaxID=5353 RepID=A0A1Q3ER84_LENED|nr:protein [Lentinula edodes]
MTGANYMGGKRNAAKARVRDSASRAQKRYFGAQRLNLAANRGSGMTEKSGVNPILDLVQTNGFTKSIPDIKLAHARQNSSNTANQIVGYIPDPIRVSPCTPKSQLRLSKISMDSNHSSSTRIMPSRVLQALDTCEPFALRAAMDQVLSLSDLAGLSRRPGRNLKRQHSSSSPCPREESNKQHKAALLFLTSSDESTFTSAEVSDLGPSRQESSSDFEEAVVESQFAFNIPDDGVLGKDDEQGHYNNRFATWTVYPNRKTDSPEMVRHIGTADRSLPRLSEPKHLNVTLTSPSYHVASENPMEYPHISNLSSQTTPGSNIFDYEDPWMAIGVMLGVEKTPLKPLKKRDFRKILAEIPTPVATPTSNVNIFATNHLVPDLIIAGSSSPSQLSDSKTSQSTKDVE